MNGLKSVCLDVSISRNVLCSASYMSAWKGLQIVRRINCQLYQQYEVENLFHSVFYFLAQAYF